jgi:GTPase
MKVIFIQKKFRIQPPEDNYGNIEYKRWILSTKLEKRATQLLFRLNEGLGRALYILGINDDGSVYGITRDELEITISNLIEMCTKVNAKIRSVRIYLAEKNKYIGTVRILLNKTFFSKR